MLPGHKEVSKSVLGLISHFSFLHNFLTFLNCFFNTVLSAILSIWQEYKTLWMLETKLEKDKFLIKLHNIIYSEKTVKHPFTWCTPPYSVALLRPHKECPSAYFHQDALSEPYHSQHHIYLWRMWKLYKCYVLGWTETMIIWSELLEYGKRIEH